MTLHLPVGWVVTDPTYAPGTGPLPDKVWCLDPETAAGSCTVSLSLAGTATRNALDVDIEGGWQSNPSFCYDERVANPQSVTVSLDVADVSSFGGRQAEHRVWTHRCGPAKVIRVEQYEVAYAPAWILYSEVADSTVSAAMSQIAQRSTLPAQTLPVRLIDRGFIRSVRTTATGYVIALDRIYADPSQPSGAINNASTTSEYTVPTSLVSRVPAVGDRVGIVSNGITVTELSLYGG